MLTLKRRKLLYVFKNSFGGSVSNASEHLPLIVIAMTQKICEGGFGFCKIFHLEGDKGWLLLLLMTIDL